VPSTSLGCGREGPRELTRVLGSVFERGPATHASPCLVHQLVTFLENLEAKEEERVWLKRQSDGELDETRLSEASAAGARGRVSSLVCLVASLRGDRQLTLLHASSLEEERVWLKRQSDGELDETRLSEGLTGESTVYKRVDHKADPLRFQLRSTSLGCGREGPRELTRVLGSLEAKEEERVWLKRQSDGELDETRLSEGLTGESTAETSTTKRIRFGFS
jgi:hypothetical protein